MSAVDIFVGLAVVVGAGLAAPLGASLAVLLDQQTVEQIPLTLAFAGGVLIWVAISSIRVEALNSFSNGDFGHDHDSLDEDSVSNSRAVKIRIYVMLSMIFGMLVGKLLDLIVHNMDDELLHRSSFFKTFEDEMESIDNKDLGIPLLPIDHHTDTDAADSDRAAAYNANDNADNDDDCSRHSESGGDPIRLSRSTSVLSTLTMEERENLSKVSLMTTLTVMIHNFPEGLITFASTVLQPRFGAMVGVAVALHNLPLGISVGLPVYQATESIWRAIGWASICGLSAIFGATVGLIIVVSSGGIRKSASGVMFGFVVGIMLWIALRQLIPQARALDPTDRYCTYFICCGFITMELSLMLFDGVTGTVH